MDNVSKTTGRLPDFIFDRRTDIELESGLTLAGMLVTDIPKGSRVKRRDRELIHFIITQVKRTVTKDPDLGQTGPAHCGQTRKRSQSSIQSTSPSGSVPPLSVHHGYLGH